MNFPTVTLSFLFFSFFLNQTSAGSWIKEPLVRFSTHLKLKNKTAKWGFKLQEILNCSFCQSFWTALVLLIATDSFKMWWVFGVSFICGVSSLIINLIISAQKHFDIFPKKIL